MLADPAIQSRLPYTHITQCTNKRFCPSSLSFSVRLDGQKQCKDKAFIPHGLQNGRRVIKVNWVEINKYLSIYIIFKDILIIKKNCCTNAALDSLLKPVNSVVRIKSGSAFRYLADT